MPESSQGNWPKVAIGGLVLLNLVLLSALALRDPSATLAAVPAAPNSTATMSPLPDSTRTPTATPATLDSSAMPTAESSDETPTATPTPSPGSSSNPVRSTRLLAVNSETLAWRADFGSCPTAPNLEVSRDGGRTWRRASSGLRSVTRLRSYSDSSVFAVGGTESCQTRYLAAGGPEESWGPNERLLGQTWYRLPKEVHRVHAPSGRLSAPCGDSLGDLAGLGTSNAAAVCADGTVRLTQDGGDSWRNLDGVAAGLALGADDNVYVLAMRKAGCDGIAVTILNPGAARVGSEAGRCASLDQVSSEELAIGVRGRVLWLWAGSDVAISTNRGRSWDRA